MTGAEEAALVVAVIGAATTAYAVSNQPKAPGMPKMPDMPKAPMQADESLVNQQQRAQQQAETAGGTILDKGRQEGSGSNPANQAKKTLTGT